MTHTFDLEPPARQLISLVAGVSDDQLPGCTPCTDTTVRGLLAHVQGLAVAFKDAADKTGPPNQDGPPGPGELDDDWRSLIPARLSALAAAWRKPEAWEGTTKVGGMTLPAATAGQIAVDELVIHGWDVARSTRQPYNCDPASLQASLEFVTFMSQPSELAGRTGLFGPVIDVPAGAPMIDRVIGLSGRDPSWTP
jgi:uncharacterized protein (TIGR03086 family)